jgi:hypothetical protein
MRRYLLAMHNMARTSNYVNPEFHGSIPKPSGPAIPWQGVLDLYQSLLSQRRLADAYMFLKVARAFMPIDKCPSALESLSNACEKAIEASPDNHILLRVTLYTLFALAEVLIGCEENDKAEEAIRRAEELCTRLPDHLTEEQQKLNAHALNIEWLRYNLIPEENYELRWTEGLRFMDLSERAGNFLRWCQTGTPMVKASKAYARECNSTARIEEYMSIYKKRQEVFEETGSILDILSDQDFLLLAAMDDMPKLRAALQWYDGFFCRYPDIEIPDMLHQSWHSRGIGYGFLYEGESEKKTRCAEISAAWYLKTPGYACEPMPIQQSSQVGPVQLVEAEVYNLEWVRAIKESGMSAVSSDNPTMHTLVTYIPIDLRSGILAKEEIWGIIHPEAYERRNDPSFLLDIPDNLEDMLKSTTTVELYDCLYGTREPVPEDTWTFRESLLTAWFDRHKDSKSILWVSLKVSIRELRAESLARKFMELRSPAHRHLLDKGLAKYRECLEIVSVNEALFSEYYKSKPGSIKGMITSYIFSAFPYTGEDPKSEYSRLGLEEAYKMSLDCIRPGRAEDRGNLALDRQIHIYMTDIACLRRSLGFVDAEDWYIEPMDLLRDLDRLSNDTRYGLEVPGMVSAVEELKLREDFTANILTDEIPQLAIKVLRLRIQDDDSEDAKKELWEWIQKAKGCPYALRFVFLEFC